MIQFLPFLLLQLIQKIDGRTIYPVDDANDNGLCIGHNGVQGQCVPITSCTVLQVGLDQRANHPKICSWNQLVPIVCCPDLDAQVNPIDSTTVYSVTTSTSSNHEPSEKSEKVRCGEKRSLTTISVVGGDEVKSALDWPWMAALLFLPPGSRSTDKIYRQFCGGTIVSESVILTAAHCFDSLKGTSTSEVLIGVGSNDLEATIKYPVRTVITHRKYLPGQSYFDIAVVVTAKPIDYNNTIRPICLPGSELKNLTNNDNLVQVAGWGRQSYQGFSSSKLRSAYLDIVPNQQCNQSYAELKDRSIPRGITKNQLCAGTSSGDKDSCQGDSGGPLTIQYEDISNDVNTYYQIGVVSFGNGCGQKGFPGVYTRITDFIPWIQKHLRRYKS